MSHLDFTLDFFSLEYEILPWRLFVGFVLSVSTSMCIQSMVVVKNWTGPNGSHHLWSCSCCTQQVNVSAWRVWQSLNLQNVQRKVLKLAVSIVQQYQHRLHLNIDFQFILLYVLVFYPILLEKCVKNVSKISFWSWKTFNYPEWTQRKEPLAGYSQWAGAHFENETFLVNRRSK